MLYKRGITIGRFEPLTVGHELMLHTAWANSDHLTVLLGDSQNYRFSYDVRYKWVHNFLDSLGARGNKTWEIIRDPDYTGPTTMDADGTVVDSGFWDFWMSQNEPYLTYATHVFTSDRYGMEVANQINTRFPRSYAPAKWFPVDPDRELYPVNATMIRNDPVANFSVVSEWAKCDVGLTIAIMGAESTGKSTMTKKLAAHYNTTYAPEWGRIISEAYSELTMDDFDNIVWMQQLMIRNAQIAGGFVSFTDTEAVVTSLFSHIYLGEPCDFAETVAARQSTIDHYIVLAPTVPLVQDGTRILDHEGRQQFHLDLIANLTSLGKPVTVIDDSTYDGRFDAAITLIDQLIVARSATFQIGESYGTGS